MKTISPGLQALYESDLLTIASCWRIKRTDGIELYFTDHQTDLPIDGNTYKASTGFLRTAIAQKEGLSVNNMDVEGIVDSTDITEEDLRAGLYNNAELWYFEVNYEDLTQGKAKLDYGNLGDVQLSGGEFTVKFRSLTQRLDQSTTEQYSRFCRNILGDENCGVDLNPTVWVEGSYAIGDSVSPSVYNGFRYVCTVAGASAVTEPTWPLTIGLTVVDGGVTWEAFQAYTIEGKVDTVFSRAQFDSTELKPFADNYFNRGVLTFTSGLNINRSMDVKSSTGTSGDIVLLKATPFDMNIGDDFIISVGCNHSFKMGDGSYTGDCKVKFSNAYQNIYYNFNGECEIPGETAILGAVSE